MAWGFLVPFVWGFSAKWMSVFLGLKPLRPKWLLAAVVAMVSPMGCRAPAPPSDPFLYRSTIPPPGTITPMAPPGGQPYYPAAPPGAPASHSVQLLDSNQPVVVDAANTDDAETLHLEGTIKPNRFGGAGVFWPGGSTNAYSRIDVSYLGN
jgi:hypothetical protein